jgi:tripartite-type tricarboxylate transporter receptor subunit TctC
MSLEVTKTRATSSPSPHSQSKTGVNALSQGEGQGEGTQALGKPTPPLPRKRGREQAAFAAPLFLIAAIACLSPLATSAHAQSAAEFYRGKSVEILVGGAAGGGYDVAARTIALHMGRHIPGNPTMVVRNMPGATGLVMTNHLYNVAKRDGTVIGMPTSNVPLEPRLKLISPDGSNAKFDVARMSWIGTPLQEPQVTWVWHTAPAKSVADLKTNVILMGATTASADNAILPLLVNALVGTRMRVVTGYVGQNEINIAAERGEVQGNNTGLSNLTVNRADWMRDGKVRILIQYGTERLPVLKDVPTAVELAGSDVDKALLRFYALKFNMARPLVTPPELPPDRVAALQSAFEATMKDDKYLADAKRIGLDTNWLGSRDMTAQVRQIAETPQAVVDRLRELLAQATAKKK